MDALREAVRELVSAPSAERADSLVVSLERAAAGSELASFISETLEVMALHEVRDSKGVSVRWRLVDRLLSLGFPYALHVSPTDLDYHRNRATSVKGTVLGVLLLIASIVSTLWMGGWSMGLLFAAHHFDAVALLALVGSLAGFGHGIGAFTSAVEMLRGGAPPRLRVLGWLFFVGPALALCGTMLEKADTGTFTMIAGSPSMLTALLCALSAAVIGGSEVRSAPALQPVSEPVDEAEARRTRAAVKTPS